MDSRTRAYLETLLWATCDVEGRPLDERLDPEDLPPEIIAEATEDVASFFAEAAEILERRNISDGQAAHDFALTRDRHGAGFWDRELGEDGEILTRMAQAYGSGSDSLYNYL